jgi:hypothetical protein
MFIVPHQLKHLATRADVRTARPSDHSRGRRRTPELLTMCCWSTVMGMSPTRPQSTPLRRDMCPVWQNGAGARKGETVTVAHSPSRRHEVAVAVAVVVLVATAAFGWSACGDSGGKVSQCGRCQQTSECRKGLVCAFYWTHCSALPNNMELCDQQVGQCEPEEPSGTPVPDPPPCPAPPKY